MTSAVDEKSAQLEWEARVGRYAAATAFLSAATIIAGLAARISIGQGSTKKAESLRIAHAHAGAVLAYSILTAIAIGLLTFVLLYLYRATKFRRPETPTVGAYVAIAGPILAMVSGVISTVQLLNTADKFLKSGPQTEARAKHLVDHSVSALVGGLGLAGALAVGVALILISINAQRAGLLSRFMSILGVIFGALQVLPVLPGPVIQIFWVTALGVLFLGRWPGPLGRGPAWETGEPEPWPSATRVPAASAEDEPDDEPEEAVAEPATQPNPNARRRKKRKTRR